MIEAIELTYSSISFGGGFFGSTDFNDLYFLINKNKGDVENLNDVNESLVDGFTPQSDSGTLSAIIDSSTLLLSGIDFRYINVNLTVETISTDYTIIIINDGNEIYREKLSTDNTIYLSNIQNRGGRYNVYVAASTAITFSKIEWDVRYEPTDSTPPNIKRKSYNITGSESFTNTFTFNVPRQMPKMKTLDFLRGLFKMFNLTAYYQNGVIVIDTLDDFYSDGDTIDLSKSLDNGDINVKRSKLYSDINFSFSEPKTFGVINQNEQNQDNFGNLEFQTLPDGKNNSLAFDGTKYEIKLPFEKGFFERMNDQDASTFTLTDFSSGWVVDKDQNETDIAPMLLYNVPTTIDDTTWKFGFVGKNQYITTFNRGSNSDVGATKSLHFGEEFDEYTGNINANSLFAIGYQNYVTNLFSINTRILSAEFYLSLDVLTQYKLNDNIVLKGKNYRINSIKSNLNTGKSTLELITSYD